MPVSEFDIIQQVFKSRAQSDNQVICGIGDDAAVIEVPTGQQLLVSTDTLVSGVHYFPDANAFDVGFKSLAVNLSDMAAMAAKPCWMTLALTLPEANQNWLNSFADGLFTLARKYQVALVGGNLAQGPLYITITIMGTVPAGTALLRSGGCVGDDIYVTGELGMASLALASLKGECRISSNMQQSLLERLYRPQPRVETGMQIRNLASACIDLSDGLASDLLHILQASSAGAEVNLPTIPITASLKALNEQHRWSLALCGGDDYELCFTAPVANRTVLERMSGQFGCNITRIGKVTTGAGIRWLDENGLVKPVPDSGYRHF